MKPLKPLILPRRKDRDGDIFFGCPCCNTYFLSAYEAIQCDCEKSSAEPVAYWNEDGKFTLSDVDQTYQVLIQLHPEMAVTVDFLKEKKS